MTDTKDIGWQARLPTGVARYIMPPGDLLNRTRWIFLAFSLVSAAVLVAPLLNSPYRGLRPYAPAVIAGLALLCLKWLIEYRAETNRLLLDFLEGAVLFCAGVAVASPFWILILLFARVSARALETSGRRSAVIAAIYILVFLGSVHVTGRANGTSPTAGIELLALGFPLAAAVMHTLGTTMTDLRRAAVHEEILRRAAEQLNRSSDRESIEAVVQSAGGALVGGAGVVSVGLGAPRDLSAPSALHGDKLTSFPVSVRQQDIEAITVRSTAPLLEATRRSLETLAQEAGLRLESLALADELQQAMQSSFRAMFENNPHPMWIYAVESMEFLAVNEAAIRHYGYTGPQFRDMKITDLHPDEDVPALLAALPEPQMRLQGVGAWRHRLRDGRLVDVELSGHTLQFAGRDAVLVLAQDVTERRMLDEQLRRQAFHDPLTDLANRALLRDRVEHALANTQRDGAKCAVLFIDLDNFKTINDSLGHSAGDEILVQAARRLQACLRPEDTVARLGGDEFALLLDSVTSLRDCVRIAERTLEALHRPFALGDDEWFISASVGIALNDAGVRDPDALLRNADVAMYSAKAHGKGRFVVFEPDMHASVLRRMALETELRGALSREELRVYYQPQVDLATGRVVGVEALVRWQHPDRGLVPPDEFIGAAEEAGLIGAVDAWVLLAACRQVRQWMDSGREALRVGVNVSALELLNDELVARVEQALSMTGLRPGQLEIEVTESVAVNAAGALPVLARLRALGVRVVIDDFGVGYSMLGRLQDFPVDKLKIDRSFIKQITFGENEAPIVAGIIAMGHSLGLTVVAEGVETTEQLNFLRHRACDEGQGYLFSRPVGADQLVALLDSHSTGPGSAAAQASSPPPAGGR